MILKQIAEREERNIDRLCKGKKCENASWYNVKRHGAEGETCILFIVSAGPAVIAQSFPTKCMKDPVTSVKMEDQDIK